jgi:hypothetical protein
MIPTVAVWLWSDAGKPSFPKWIHSKYDHRHVNAVYRMVQRHYKTPHRFVCITDNPEGIECETIPLWGDLLYMEGIIPGTWTRLKVWQAGMSELLGPRLISIDLDCVIVDDVAPLFDDPAPFLGWFARGGPEKPCVYNASFWAMDVDSRPDIWTSFNPETAVQELLDAGFKHYHGTEQAWQSYKLGPDHKAFTWRDGMVSYRYQMRKDSNARLPKGSRIVFFHGPGKPWHRLRDAWVARHYPAKEVGLC